jgi:hypothetical protein
MFWIGSIVGDRAGEIGSVATNIDVEVVRTEWVIGVSIAVYRRVSMWEIRHDQV